VPVDLGSDAVLEEQTTQADFAVLEVYDPTVLLAVFLVGEVTDAELQAVITVNKMHGKRHPSRDSWTPSRIYGMPPICG
jgi:hypothetical protein